jgi:mannose/cellobiose epimerase-like protein (N-acyl-D-glucosamine 2-epimerase family)
MHLVEALLAASDATEDPFWRRQALEVARDYVHEQAPKHGWLVPEHRAPDGSVLPEFNADRKDDPFRPYGATPGHAFEWARLLICLEAAMTGAGEPAPEWLATDARQLFDVATAVGWTGDGTGFVYTVDWAGRPVVPARFHWVLCEAIAAAAVLYRRTGEPSYADRYAEWWSVARAHYLDLHGGSWWHELRPDGRPNDADDAVWPGKPDIYHAYQATLVPVQPPGGSLAGSLAVPPPL